MPPAVKRSLFTIGAINDFERFKQRFKVAREIGPRCPLAIAGDKYIVFAFAFNYFIQRFAFEIGIEL